MPVYLITSHAYGSWSEDHPNGYVQRDEGLKPSAPGLAKWRDDHSSHGPAEFDHDSQLAILDIVEQITAEKQTHLHGAAATKTHVHKLISFRSPACTCGATNYCKPDCAARVFAEKVATRLKQKMGQAVAKLNSTNGRPWFSRGWDLSRVADKAHFDYLLGTYLPKHATRENGIVRIYDKI
jgi:hypothetical protein